MLPAAKKDVRLAVQQQRPGILLDGDCSFQWLPHCSRDVAGWARQPMRDCGIAQEFCGNQRISPALAEICLYLADLEFADAMQILIGMGFLDLFEIIDQEIARHTDENDEIEK